MSLGTIAVNVARGEEPFGTPVGLLFLHRGRCEMGLVYVVTRFRHGDRTAVGQASNLDS